MKKEHLPLFSQLVGEFNNRIKYCKNLVKYLDPLKKKNDDIKLTECQTLLLIVLFDYVCVLRLVNKIFDHRYMYIYYKFKNFHRNGNCRILPYKEDVTSIYNKVFVNQTMFIENEDNYEFLQLSRERSRHYDEKKLITNCCHDTINRKFSKISEKTSETNEHLHEFFLMCDTWDGDLNDYIKDLFALLLKQDHLVKFQHGNLFLNFIINF
jgi:hypothetical protein